MIQLDDTINEFEWDGIMWYRQTGRKYFRSKRDYSFTYGRSFHRYIWVKYHGTEIPKGFYIHHIDGDHYNNDPSNLEMMDGRIHSSIHLLGKPKSIDQKQKIAESMKGNHNRNSLKSRLKAKKTKQINKLRQYLNL